MMAFFELWHFKRVRMGKWLILIIILLLCSFQMFTLFEIFHYTKNEYTNNINTLLLNKTKQLCLTKSSPTSLALLSYNYNDHTLHIEKKDHFLDTIIHLPPDIDNNQLICQGDYDIRDTNIWSLDSLGSLLQADFRLQGFIPTYILTLTDIRNNKILDKYHYSSASTPFWTFQKEIRLGFLENHLLTAKFTYSISYFWNKVGDEIITTLILFLLLFLFSIALFIQLRNERKISDYRKKFTHTLVHNLRGPLIFLKQELESIEVLSLTPEEKQQALNKCKGNNNNILKNIEHLLVFSVNTYGLKAHPEIFNLTTLLNKLAEMYYLHQPEKEVSITLGQTPFEPTYADPTLLEGALGNILANSIKYSGKNCHIHINCQQAPKQLIITVTDNGYGIPPDEQKHIFRENYRGRQYMTDCQHKGFGLGLYYVQSVVLAHQGNISVKSDGRNGSEFILKIPQKHKSS